MKFSWMELSSFCNTLLLHINLEVYITVLFSILKVVFFIPSNICKRLNIFFYQWSNLYFLWLFPLTSLTLFFSLGAAAGGRGRGAGRGAAILQAVTWSPRKPWRPRPLWFLQSETCTTLAAETHVTQPSLHAIWTTEEAWTSKMRSERRIKYCSL